METNNRIRKEVSKNQLSVSRVYKADYQKEGTQTAELKQVVTTTSYYPTKVVENSLQDNVFSAEEFGFSEKPYVNDETRVAWIDVPEGMSMDQVKQKIASVAGASLYRVLSNKPIIADTEQYAIDSPDLDVTLDTFAERQAVRYPAGSEDAGKLALDANGKIQYRRIAFSKNSAADQDERTLDPADFYASANLAREINGMATVPGQLESQTIGG